MSSTVWLQFPSYQIISNHNLTESLVILMAILWGGVCCTAQMKSNINKNYLSELWQEDIYTFYYSFVLQNEMKNVLDELRFFLLLFNYL